MAIDNRDLPAGTRLAANYKKQRHVCTLEANEEGEGVAFVLESGKRFKSPSAAASAVMGGKAVNGWRFWSLEGEAPAGAPAAPTEPKGKAKKGTRSKKLISKVPNHAGDAEGARRYWCTACMKSFLAEGEGAPEVCPEGHRSDDPELTAPAGEAVAAAETAAEVTA